MKLSIIIPVFNEAPTVKKIINLVQSQPLPKITKEIIVIDDGSTDGSTKIIKSTPNIKKVFLPVNSGKGAAIRAGLKQATGEYVLIQDADLEYSPEDIKLLLTPVFNRQAQVVYGTRFLGPHRNMLFWHLAGNKFLSFVTNILYNTTLSDMEVGYKLIPSSLIKSLALKENRFGFEPEITSNILKQGLRI